MLVILDPNRASVFEGHSTHECVQLQREVPPATGLPQIRSGGARAQPIPDVQLCVGHTFLPGAIVVVVVLVTGGLSGADEGGCERVVEPVLTHGHRSRSAPIAVVTPTGVGFAPFEVFGHGVVVPTGAAL